MNTNRFFSMASIVTVIAFILVVGASPVLAASAPMRVATGGLTVEQQLAAQAELSNRLLGDLPSTAMAVRIPLTVEEAAAIDASKSKVPLKIGVVKAISPRVEVRGKTIARTPSREGGLVWAAVFNANNAGAIRLHVENMSLPANTKLYLYSRNGQAYGPYTGRGPHRTGEFWTATIFGREAILQLHAATKSDLNRVSFRVQKAGLITSRYTGGSPDVLNFMPAAPLANWPCDNPNCVEDASCYGGIADTLSLAVAKMEWVQGAFLYTCTGGLINDFNPSQNNFFLTANHCVSKNNTARNVNFYWRFATSACEGTCPSNSGWSFQTQGATVSATNKKGDFTLLHLNSAPPGGSVFLGWTSAPVANSNGTDLFRVSNPNFGPQVYSEHDVDTSAPTCSGWPRGQRIYSRDTLGAIDGGSSGSPIVNGAGQIVGQLSGTCGSNPSDPCASGPGEDNATVDGAFAFYFPTVEPILDP